MGKQLNAAFSECPGIPSNWNTNNKMIADPTATDTTPYSHNLVITLSCEVSHRLQGSEKVTCKDQETFEYGNGEPSCVEKGMGLPLDKIV